MKKVRYGIVGLKHGSTHIHPIQALPQAELAAVCDLDAKRLAGVRDAYKLHESQCYTNVRDMLRRPDVDAVVVATPPAAHKEVALAVIKAGKHLFLEKPLAHTLADGKAIVKAAAKARTVSQIGFCVRSSQLVDKCRQIIDSGELGKVVLLWFNMFVPYSPAADDWRNNPDLGGGKLFDCCCHYYDMMAYIAGGHYHRVCAFGGPVGATGPLRKGLPDVVNTIVEMDNGAKLTLNLSEVTKAPYHSFFGIVGTKGKIESDPWSPQGAGSLKLYSDEGLYTTDIVINGQMASTGHLGFLEQHKRFIDTITARRANVCTTSAALENLALLDAVLRSLRTGQVVKL